MKKPTGLERGIRGRIALASGQSTKEAAVPIKREKKIEIALRELLERLTVARTPADIAVAAGEALQQIDGVDPGTGERAPSR
jgi:hypothetical protein